MKNPAKNSSKLATKTPLPAFSTSEKPLDIAKSALGVGMRAIEAQIRRLAALPELDHAAASHLAWLMKQIAQVQAEQRKQDAHDRKAATDVDPSTVASYLRQLNKAAWSHLRREIDRHHTDGGVIG